MRIKISSIADHENRISYYAEESPESDVIDLATQVGAEIRARLRCEMLIHQAPWYCHRLSGRHSGQSQREDPGRAAQVDHRCRRPLRHPERSPSAVNGEQVPGFADRRIGDAQWDSQLPHGGLCSRTKGEEVVCCAEPDLRPYEH